MKEDFEVIKTQLPGICKIASDFYQQPKKKGSVFFVKSPKTADKHESLCLYPDSGRFVDFANGNQSGDVIGFVSYIKDINNWEALKVLRDFYGLTDSREQDKQEARRRIQRQKEEERRRSVRKGEFKAALSAYIDDLKHLEYLYSVALKNALFKPFSDVQAYLVLELQKVRYKLDILCCADEQSYRRLKPNHEANLPSDRPQWLLDSLALLGEHGVFQAMGYEIREIEAQRNFELTRKPGGAVRRCEIEW